MFVLTEFQKRAALLKQEFLQTPTLLQIRGDLNGNALFTQAFYLQTNKQTNKQAATTSLPARDSLIC